MQTYAVNADSNNHTFYVGVKRFGFSQCLLSLKVWPPRLLLHVLNTLYVLLNVRRHRCVQGCACCMF